MKLMSKNVSRTASVLGAVGLSAIALVSGIKPASAVNIGKGSDFFQSPAGGSTFVFNDIALPLAGSPIKDFPGNTDTIVQRKQDCTFVSGSCTIDIEMTHLSLKSQNPVTIGGFKYDVFATLDPAKPTTGKMTIQESGTFDSFLDVFYKAEFTPIDGGQIIPDFFDNFSGNNSLKQSGAKWSHNPQLSKEPIVRKKDNNVLDEAVNCHTQSGDCAPTDFFIIGEVKHEKGSPTFPDGHTTKPPVCDKGGCDFIVDQEGKFESVPEPLTILGSGLALGFGAFLRKKYSRQLKQEALS